MDDKTIVPGSLHLTRAIQRQITRLRTLTGWSHSVIIEKLKALPGLAQDERGQLMTTASSERVHIGCRIIRQPNRQGQISAFLALEDQYENELAKPQIEAYEAAKQKRRERYLRRKERQS